MPPGPACGRLCPEVSEPGLLLRRMSAGEAEPLHQRRIRWAVGNKEIAKEVSHI